MLLWEMPVLCEDRKGRVSVWDVITLLLKGELEQHSLWAADALVFHFFPGPSLSLKPMRQRRDGALRAQPRAVCDLHQVLEMILLPGLPS